MKKAIKIIFKSFSSLFLIIGFLSCEKDVKVVLSKEFLEERMKLLIEKKEPRTDIIKNYSFEVCEKVFPDILIDTIYYDSQKKIVGFQYSLNSANYGIAKIFPQKDEVSTIGFYNQLDLSIEFALKPSFSIFYKLDKNGDLLAFDSYSNKFIQLNLMR